MTDEILVSVIIDDCEALGASIREFGGRLQTGAAVFSDRRGANRRSPWAFESDGAMGLGMISEMGGELIASSASLIRSDQCYSAAALIRQLLEVEYVVWWFGNDYANEAKTWMRTPADDVWELFKPSRLRKMAKGEFDKNAYDTHCRLGGHPNPSALHLLRGIALKPSRGATVSTLADELAYHGTSLLRRVRSAVKHEDLARNLLKSAENRVQEAIERLVSVRRPDEN